MLGYAPRVSREGKSEQCIKFNCCFIIKQTPKIACKKLPAADVAVKKGRFHEDIRSLKQNKTDAGGKQLSSRVSRHQPSVTNTKRMERPSEQLAAQRL